MSLTTIKKRPRETLRSFLERFNVAAASVDRPEPSMVLMAAVSGVLDNSEFKKSLYRDPPRNLGEFYLEADRFLREEDATSEKKTLEVNMLGDGEPPNPGKGNDKGKGKTPATNDRNAPPRRGSRYDKYTELNDTLSNIYVDTGGAASYPRPPKREPTLAQRNSGRHCIFHDIDGHNTDDCRHLRDLIEDRVRRGELPEYVTRPTTPTPALPPPIPQRGNDPGSSNRGIIIR